MLTADGQVKILDLGLARLHGDTVVGGELTETSQIMGTVDYMAPEQACDTHTVDGRADIYSLGCTLFKILVGEAPFGGERFRSPAQKMLAHLQAPVPSVAERRGDVPDTLAAVVERTLAKSPAARYATAADLAAALSEYSAGSDLRALYATATAADGSILDSHRARGPSPGDTDPRLLSPGSETPLVANPAASSAAAPVAADITESLNTVTVRRPPSGGRRLFLGLAGAAAVALGVVIVVKMRDGSSRSFQVDGDVEQVTMTQTGPADAKPADVDRAAAEWVLAKGGWVDVAVDDQTHHVMAAAKLPSQPFRVRYVWLRDIHDVADQDLQRLKGLTEIRHLDLWGTPIGDSGVAHLAGLHSLWSLNLRVTRVTDVGLKSLAGLTELDGLDIVYDAFTDEGLSHLTTLKKLRFLQAFTSQRVGDAGLRHLGELTRLEHLSVNAVNATDAGLAFVENLPALEALDLLDTPVGDEGLKHIAQATRLKWLRFGDAGITVDGWRALLPLSRLKGLHVMGRELGDRALEGIAQLTELDDLTISGFAAGDAGLKQLARMTNLKRLVIDPGENVTDAGLVHLEALPKLKDLTLVSSKVTAAGVERLKKTLPDCTISF
jgi:hypothetical protein